LTDGLRHIGFYIYVRCTMWYGYQLFKALPEHH